MPTHTFMWPGKSGGHGLSTQSSVCRALIGCFGAAIVGLIEIDTESLAIVHYPHKPTPRGVPKVGIESLQLTSITTSAAAYLRLRFVVLRCFYQVVGYELNPVERVIFVRVHLERFISQGGQSKHYGSVVHLDVSLTQV